MRDDPIVIKNTAIACYNDSIRLAPTNPDLAYRLALSAVEIDPTLHQGWARLAEFLVQRNNLPAGCAALRRALEYDPTNPKYLTNLGLHLHNSGQNHEALRVTLAALEQDPSLALAHCNLSLIMTRRGDHKRAVEEAEKAYHLDIGNPLIETGLAFAHLFAGNYAMGLRHFEARFAYKLPDFLNYPCPKWQGQDLRGQKLFIQAEQGIGDTLCYSRFFAMIDPDCQIILAVQPELLRLFKSMFSFLAQVDIRPLPCSFPEADYWTTPTSLPVWLGIGDDVIMRAPWPRRGIGDIDDKPSWKIAGRKLHVGIAWAGSPSCDIEKWRGMPVENFLELTKVNGVQLYSLQVGPRSKDLRDRGCDGLIKDLSPYIRDVSDTLAIIDNLDLIITIETSLGWMAALAHKECWVACSYNGQDYRFPYNRPGRVLWGDKHMVFRQGSQGRWDTVMRDIKDCLVNHDKLIEKI